MTLEVFIKTHSKQNLRKENILKTQDMDKKQDARCFFIWILFYFFSSNLPSPDH